MHVIRDRAAGSRGQDQRWCTSKSITAGKGNSKPLPYTEGHHLQRNNNGSTIGLNLLYIERQSEESIPITYYFI